jgi:hypothetical protein
VRRGAAPGDVPAITFARTRRANVHSRRYSDGAEESR